MQRWLIISACVIAASSAHADGLTWHAPPECPDDQAVRHAIERRLEAPLESVAFAVDVEITHDATGFVATVKTGSEPRVLTSASCEEVTDAVAVVVARLATAAREAATTPPPSVPPPPAPALAVTAAPVIVQPAPFPWHGGLRVTAIVGSGNVPSIGAAGELAAWLGWRDAFVELAAARWFTRRATFNNSMMAGVDVQLDALALRAGWQHRMVRGWLGGELGQMHGNGVGLTTTHDGGARWLSVGGGVGAVWNVRAHVRALAGVDLEIVIDRVQFALDSGEVIYRSSALAARGGVGLEVTWN